MKVRLIKKRSIEEFALQNAASRSSFRIWLTAIKNTDWTEPGDISDTFGSADLLGHGSNRIVFNIAGNNFRMICKYHFGITKVHLYIKWIGTHAETLNFVMTMSNILLTPTKFKYMETLQYKIIKTAEQYNKYCNVLETLIDSGKKTKAIKDKIELLSLLIEKYDAEHNTFDDADPIELLKSLMKEHKLKAVNLAELLNISEGLVSDMLHYKKGLSKGTIRILSERFKLNQEAFNRTYKLVVPVSPKFKNARMMNTRKNLTTA